ncbi:hypothetical protein GUITHDRAFT_142374 [Guillardia theta CCMP2712]|uniref:Uncharacterized protein n=1 Tax=Guillardia theta (strain CCMP2712) TaxID=905079 RepID=L1IY02_GUITC|nr:hypothetical protein GUITHDRAFT_142374 [Guillardia theta CCMP2712]EKX40977.1 hypothetical protein GUITHDRAFT_142374 [Guillardia theta CCMP2712]|eukprot:XP_005827957.1 hypothetical protein GUITHDRAFT_142374 [Guillardia theta CCMP2712]
MDASPIQLYQQQSVVLLLEGWRLRLKEASFMYTAVRTLARLMLSQDFAVAALAEKLLQSEEGDMREAMVKELGEACLQGWYITHAIQDFDDADYKGSSIASVVEVGYLLPFYHETMAGASCMKVVVVIEDGFRQTVWAQESRCPPFNETGCPWPLLLPSFATRREIPQKDFHC